MLQQSYISDQLRTWRAVVAPAAARTAERAGAGVRRTAPRCATQSAPTLTSCRAAVPAGGTGRVPESRTSVQAVVPERPDPAAATGPSADAVAVPASTVSMAMAA